MLTDICKNMPSKFVCKKCDYSCNKQFLWKQHINTIKHNTYHGLTEYLPKYAECECGKTYKHKQSLYNHKKICKYDKSALNTEGTKAENKVENKVVETKVVETKVVETKVESSELSDIKSMFIQTMKQNGELQKQIVELIPKIGSNNNNNNNNFNLNIFLNEQCKDALNISDFVESLQIQLEDLDNTKDYGLVKGISSVFMKGLRQLDMYKRPIHCTDVKRETLYIKDKDAWEKDDKSLLKKSIVNIANKQRKSVQAWENSNPDWHNTDKGQADYLNLVNNTMNVIETDSADENKIIKSIVKEVVIDK